MPQPVTVGYTPQTSVETPIGISPVIPPRGGKGVVTPGATPSSTPKIKKGVKRKAEMPNDSPAAAYDPLYTPGDSKAAKVATRRESVRQIKKVSVFFNCFVNHRYIFFS